mgnify:CR=1 FL=1
MHAAAYLLKPITEDKLRRELNELERMNEEIPEPPRLVVHTFGNFEAFWKGRPLDWERDKAKELLAYLVDRRGAAVSSAEIALVLLGDDAKVRNVQTIISSLHKTLNSVGAGDVLIKRRNRTAIDVSKIQCDMYDVFGWRYPRRAGVPGAVYVQLQLGGVYQRLPVQRWLPLSAASKRLMPPPRQRKKH